MSEQVFDASNSKVRVFTYKDGLLSKIAHDLEIDVQRFSIRVDLDGDAVQNISARFETGSLTVLHAVTRNGPQAVSEGDKQTIRRNIEKDVLESVRFPEAVFVSRNVTERADNFQISGTLTLHGQARDVDVRVARLGARLRAEVDLHQPNWGIKPYSAMMGTLRVQPRVRVVVETTA